LIHRDLKPTNLMVTTSDLAEYDAFVVKVIDFGLAKAAAAGLMPREKSRPGFSGTPDFASPEQLKVGPESLDIRSDIYSLGVILWYLLCGRRPFPGRALGEVYEQRLPWDQLLPAHVPGPVLDLLGSMLALDRTQRPRSARDLVSALQRCHQIIANPAFSPE
jgi:serine/threonine-protein kinase